MKRLKNVKMRKILAFMVSLALMVSCMPSAYTISADEIFGDGTEELVTDGEDTSVWTAEEITSDVNSTGQEQQSVAEQQPEEADQAENLDEQAEANQEEADQDGQAEENQTETPDGNLEENQEKNSDEAEEVNLQDTENAEKDDSEPEEDQNTEAYIRDDIDQMAEKEGETAEEEVTDMEQEKPVTYTSTVNNVVVTANAESGVIPEDAKFVVTPVEKESDQYSEVAAQLENKAESEDYSIAGFLAYDIYFTGSDGQKINPEDGKVKISMEYQESAAPEEVKEAEAATLNLDDADSAQNGELFQSGENENAAQQAFDIAVMHLVEDENGNVQSVVDMTQDGMANVEANAEGEVQKAEFETESFSVFTIAWKNSSNTLRIQLIDTAGVSIGNDQSQNLKSNNEVKVSSIAPEVTGYSFYKAKVSSTAADTGTEIKRLRYSGGSNQYNSADSNGSWRNVNGNVYFVYAKNPEAVETVDHTRDGITMRMKDLVGDDNSEVRAIGENINSLIDIGGSYGDGSIKKNLLNNRIRKPAEYPTTVKNGKSLESLFNGKEVNHLFLKSVYDATGYYEYSSFKNYAYLGDNSSFTVYDAIGTPKNEDRYFYKRGNFMPYNEIANGKFSTNANLYDEDGKELADTDPEKGKELYLTQGTNDYYFGMYMGANFLQPKAGKATLPDGSTKQDMIYEFNGDDDMWVYIDNVLVLDIGGVHDAHSGKINFNTGVVSWKDCQTDNDPVESSTTLKAIFQAAGVFPDGISWDESKVGNYFTGDTFKDYTTHTFKMFYMERGAGASNLHVKFNIQVIPSGQVEVRKELSNTDKEKYSNVKFAFQVYAQKILSTDADGNETYSDTEYELLKSAVKGNAGKPTETPIDFYDGEDVNGKTYDGVFYLKPDESAIFTGLKANRKYYVKEVGVRSEEYDQITINNTSYTEFDENNEQTGEVKDIMTDTKQVSERPVVVYTNNCSAANRRELQITKKMNPDAETDDTFSFKVGLGPDKDHLQAYSGEYYLRDKSGNYYAYDENHNLVNKGQNSTVCGTTDNGIISGIRKDYTVAITGIISGTYYRVTEENLDTQNKYKDPLYEIRNEVMEGDSGHQNETSTVGNEGIIKLYYNAAMTVTNTPYSKIKVNKIWKAGSLKMAGEVPVYVGLYQKTVKDDVETLTPVKDKYLELNTENNYEAVFDKLDSRVEYVVKELRPAAGTDTADFTIDVGGTKIGYVKTDSTIMIGDVEYEVNYSDLAVDESDAAQKNITITNKRYGSITIIKTDSSDQEIFLEGAKFKLQKDGQDVKDESGNVITVTTDSEGRAKFDRLEPGIYTIVEIEAPEGYSITGAAIQVTVGIDEGQLLDVVQTIRNAKLYSLPDSGGPGIYGFTISGVAILATALLLFINSKRREEEAERS